ncbi:MAG: acylphosphatase [Methanobacteriota archaeon]
MRVRLVIVGKVQGVWFRAAMQKEARRLGVRGWVRNLPDGSVEAVAEGEPAAVEALVAWSHEGPPGARVVDVHVTPAGPDEGSASFDVRYS